MANLPKMQKQLLEGAMQKFTDTWLTHNPEEPIKLRFTPTAHILTSDSGAKIQLGLSLEIKKHGEVQFTVIKRDEVRGLAKDAVILTEHLYATMFVSMIETALLVSVANIDRQNEETQRASNKIIN